jgi:radical SAM protein with 4Fe4S-binding SPASM domain
MLPDSFAFTQQNLQEYADCPYRFYLREIQKLEWPAIESEPVHEQEELMLLGTRFHLLCQQYFCGIPAETLTAQISDPLLLEWWQNFLRLKMMPAAGSFSVERLFSIPFAGYRLAAKFDLIFTQENGRLSIYDWKTSQHQPKRQTVLSRMQSKVYPLLAASIYPQTSPESISMVYWYPAFPDTPISFSYSAGQFTEDRHFLEQIIREISQKQSEKEFQQTEHEKTCDFCRYRSLCNRGTAAGISDLEEALSNMDEAFNLDFDAV